jgi:hypothetical protein
VSDVTRILEAAQQGDPTAAEKLLPLVYEELRKLVTAKMTNKSACHPSLRSLTYGQSWRLVLSCDFPRRLLPSVLRLER